MSKPSIEFPVRLIEDAGAPAELLRQSLDEPRQFPSESSSWRGLVEKRDRPPRPVGFALVFAGACALCLVWLGIRNYGSYRVAAHADVLVALPTANPNQTSPAATASKMPDIAPRSLRSPTMKAEPKAMPDGLDAVRATPEGLDGDANKAASQSPRVPSEDTAACSQTARDGKLEEAASCYSKIAEGNGMAAELALYEKARLESRALGRGAAALSTLEEHARRFPRGVLSTEAGLTRIELLTRLGRANDALEAITLALVGPIGKERGGDLYAMRGDLLSSRGDCTGAVVAYAAARRAGIHPSRLIAGEKRCPPAVDSASSEPDFTP